MRSALPDVPAPELSAIVRAVRARPWRDRHLRSAAVAFAAILLIFLHGATVAAWNFPQASSGAQEENQMLSLRQIAVVSSLAVSSSALAQNAVQWRVQDGGNGHWYRVTAYGQFFSFAQAQEHALSAGGHLVSISSAAEESIIFSLISGASCVSCGSSSAFIGAEQAPGSVEPAGGWRWITGEPWSYTNWFNGEPNNCCGGEDVGALRCAGGWIDAARNLPSGSVCSFAAIIEWSADCNGDGLVDFGQIRDGTLADSNSNNIPDCCESTQGCNPCPADVDGSGAVNGVDLAAILNVWGTSGGKYPGADVNHDGIVNGADLSEVLNGWGPCP